MLLFLKKTSKSYYLFNILLAFLPISFIAGNLVINLNMILIIISALLIFGRDLIKMKFFLLDKLIFTFFLLIIITGIYNDLYFITTNAYPAGYNTIIKSLAFLRYLLLYITLRFLIEKELIDLKFFFISCLLCSLFVSFDIFYQLNFGKDIFGFEMIGSGRRLSGPFGDELIAGGYLLRFSIFSFFLIPLFYPNVPKNFIKYLIPFLVIIFITGIILSGNRMPLIMFVFTIFLISIFQKQTRKYFLVFLVTFTIIFSLIFKFNFEVKTNFFNFYNQVTKMIVLVSKQDFQNEKSPLYLQEFVTFYDTWLLNKYFGGGIKNFRYYCHVRPNIKKDAKFICNMHPHNYYLEILTETGVVGMMIVLLIFSQIIFLSFYKKYFTNSSLKQNNYIIPFIFLFISEIFPLKSTGSFFTTNNATYLFLIIAILIGLVNRNNLIENKY